MVTTTTTQLSPRTEWLTVEVLGACVHQLLLDVVHQRRLRRLRIARRIAVQEERHILGSHDVRCRSARDVAGRDPQRALALQIIDKDAPHCHASLFIRRVDITWLVISKVAARNPEAGAGYQRIWVARREVVDCRRVVAEAAGIGDGADPASDADDNRYIYPDARWRQAEEVVVVGRDFECGDAAAGIVVVDRFRGLHLCAHAIAEEDQGRAAGAGAGAGRAEACIRKEARPEKENS